MDKLAHPGIETTIIRHKTSILYWFRIALGAKRTLLTKHETRNTKQIKFI